MNTNDLTRDDITLWQNTFDKERVSHVNSKTEQQRKLSICGDLLILKAVQNYGFNSNPLVTRDTFGKPYLKNIPLHFNISHKNDTAVCAFGSKNVGVDIEDIKPFKESVAKRICNSNELKFIGNNEERFATIWTIKEAFSKFNGKGISFGFSSIIIDIENQTVNNIPFIIKRFKNYICAIVFED